MKSNSIDVIYEYNIDWIFAHICYDNLKRIHICFSNINDLSIFLTLLSGLTDNMTHEAQKQV
jgi:hypothetical protein